MTRDDAVKAIFEERARQDEQWGGAEHDKEHTALALAALEAMEE